MGWGLGANDAANVFGPQAYSGIISYRWAVRLTALFVILGAVFEGDKCFAQISGMTSSVGISEIFIATLAAAIVIHIMSYLRLPASTSHAIVGSLVGMSIVCGGDINTNRLITSILCWIVTPIGAALISYIIYSLLDKYWSKNVKNLMVFNLIIKIASILIGCYGAYSLGANNLANVVGPFVGTKVITPFAGKIMGGMAIAVGVLTYSKNVMKTVGKGITVLDPFSALVTILSGAIVLHFFAQLGIPVSSSQAIVGAVLGVGILKGTKTVSFKKIIHIFIGWFATLGGSILVAVLVSLIYKVAG